MTTREDEIREREKKATKGPWKNLDPIDTLFGQVSTS